MHRYVPVFFALICSSVIAQTTAPSAVSTVQTSAGTALPLVIVRPLSRKGAAVKDAVYAQTLAPVVRNGQVLIPVGTQLQGEVEAVVQPRFFHPHATVTIHF